MENKEPIDAILILKFGNPYIYKLKHKNVDYLIEKTGLHYSFKKGSTTYHLFGVVGGGSFFKVELSTKTLNCYLLERKPEIW